MPKIKAKKQETLTETPTKTLMETPTKTPTESPITKMNSNNFSNETEYDKIENILNNNIENEQNNIENEQNNVETEPKKKRGRKRKGIIEIEELQPEIDLTPILEIAIKRLPNPEPLTDIEKGLFNSTANKVFQKYSVGFKYIEEVNLSLVLISIIYPRLKKNES